MRSKRDAKINRQIKQKAPSPAGGKVLRRLFAYLAERDPSLNNDVVATLVIPKGDNSEIRVFRNALARRRRHVFLPLRRGNAALLPPRNRSAQRSQRRRRLLPVPPGDVPVHEPGWPRPLRLRRCGNRSAPTTSRTDRPTALIGSM